MKYGSNHGKGGTKNGVVKTLGGSAPNSGTKYMSSSDYSVMDKGTNLGGK